MAVVVIGCGGVRNQSIEESRTRIELSKDYLRKQQLEAAETEAQKAVALHSSDEEAHYVLGLIDLVYSNNAHRLLEIDSCLTGIDAEVQQLEKEQRLAAAAEHLRRACELAPDFGEAWANLGVVATLLGSYDEAIAHLSRALGNPTRLQSMALARANLGWAYFLTGDLVSATKELLQATQLQTRMCITTYRLGRVYFARKEWEKALQKFQQATGQMNCPIQDAHLYLMKTHVELGVADTLAEDGQACVALAPRSCIAAQCRELASAAATMRAPVPDGAGAEPAAEFAVGRPVSSRPVSSRPVSSPPVSSRPVSSRPVLSRPVLSRPVSTREASHWEASSWFPMPLSQLSPDAASTPNVVP